MAEQNGNKTNGGGSQAGESDAPPVIWRSSNFRPAVVGADQQLLGELHAILEASGELPVPLKATDIFSFMCRMVRAQMMDAGVLKEPKEKSPVQILRDGALKREEALAKRQETPAAAPPADQGGVSGAESDKSSGSETGDSDTGLGGEEPAGSGKVSPPKVPELAKPVNARELDRRNATKDSECASLNCKVMIKSGELYDWHLSTKQAFCTSCGDAQRAAA